MVPHSSCYWSGCGKPATYKVARSGTDVIGHYCKSHATKKVKELNDG